MKYVDSSNPINRHPTHKYWYPEDLETDGPLPAEGSLERMPLWGDSYKSHAMYSLHDVPDSMFENNQKSRLQQLQMLRRSNSIDPNLPFKKGGVVKSKLPPIQNSLGGYARGGYVEATNECSSSKRSNQRPASRRNKP